VFLSRIFGLARDSASLLLKAPAIERQRVTLGPEAAIRRARLVGAKARRRDGAALEDLRRAIRFLDRRWPGGPNCYRRVLLELATDAGAARLPVQMGLRASGGPRSGHAWLGTGVVMDRPGAPPYDTIISL
jgi:hypothetical protein